MWQFWIDRGGTFTDCLGRDPANGRVIAAKVLSCDRAPLIGIRQILGLEDGAAIPPCQVRMGTTIATNALLTRTGAACALVTNRGFRDLLAIGNQTRPAIFALDIVKPELLYRQVVEVDARVGADQRALADLDERALADQLRELPGRGVASLAVVLMHAYRPGGLAARLEARIAELARSLGFAQVSCSHEVTAELGMVGRGDTTVVDAYLTPLIRAYVAGLRAELPGSDVRIMQSSGGLTDADLFRGRNAVLSGPAGGVVAYAHVAQQAGFARAIGFDMGGTSTDVSCFDGEFERVYETEVAGVRLRAPMMAIHTVAAGGGSLCRYRGMRLTVGPESAGADPGPLCYGHPEARELAITDINVALGRVVDDRFPFPLARDRVRAALDQMAAELGPDYSPERLAAGFFAIANANMVEAIRQVSIARGRDARDYAMVVFGGAGGQHACAVARLLGVRTLIFDRFAGVLSAYGMGLADVSWHGETDAGAIEVGRLNDRRATFRALTRAGERELRAQRIAAEHMRAVWRVDARYRGTETPITLDVPDTDGDTDGDTDETINIEKLAADFAARHRAVFGYDRPDHPLEVVTLRVEVRGVNAAAIRPRTARPHSEKTPAIAAPAALRTSRMWTGTDFADVPVFAREDIVPGTRIAGPALILEDTGTIALDPGFSVTCDGAGRLLAVDHQPVVTHTGSHTDTAVAARDVQVDPIRLEIFNNVFMSIATQMGHALQRTAMSTNIRERLDFSCAIFDPGGGLVANAPHIPVHLGAMSESIRGVLAAHPQPPPGAVFASNDPNAGGSHLPDVTVMTPVYDASGTELLFFCASRGHHADIGGMTPGSMPPFSERLAQEGALLSALPIVTAGTFDEAGVRAVLAHGRYPARDPDCNVADLQAQIAANQAGARLLLELVARYGPATVHAYMSHVQDNAAARVQQAIAALPDGEHHFADALDDGSPVCVTLRVAGARMAIDFTGTGRQLDGNLNAPRAVTVAAVIYVLRALTGAPIPLNSGCLRPVDITIPRGSLLWPDGDRAVAGGNVETSQRVVDVLLGALGIAAASQGTMNNLTFGNEHFGYYETIAGGAGATATARGASGVHTHMTNTRITDPEVLESRFPVRLRQFSLRRDSGGVGRHRGGDGVIREFELTAPMRVSIISERRTRAPFGLRGGDPGAPGRNLHNDREVAGKASFDAQAGDRIRIETPGGGGYDKRD